MSDEQGGGPAAADPRLLGLFTCCSTIGRWKKSLASHELSKPDCTLLLAQLERTGLIEVGVNDQVKLRVPKSLRLQRNGPIRRAHGKSVVGDFLQADFVALGAFFRFEFRDLSKKPRSRSSNESSTALGRSSTNWLSWTATCRQANAKPSAWLLGIRPWTMQWVTGIKKHA